MNVATVPPTPGIAPISVPVSEPRMTIFQCLKVARIPVRTPSSFTVPASVATVPPSIDKRIISAIPNNPTSAGMSGMPSHK